MEMEFEMKTKCSVCQCPIKDDFLNGRCGDCVGALLSTDFFTRVPVILSVDQVRKIHGHGKSFVLVDFNLYPKEIIGSPNNTEYPLVYAKPKNDNEESYKLYGLTQVGSSIQYAMWGPASR